MYVLNTPLVDLTTINAVESLFHPSGATDPHKYQLAGQLGNMVAYAREVRYPLPVRSDREPEVPGLLASLQSRDQGLFRPIKFLTDQKVSLAAEHLEPAFQQFMQWSNGNAFTLKKTIRFHTEDWIRKGHSSRVQGRYVYDVSRLRNRAEVSLLANFLQTTEEMIFYTFDVAIRYSLYGRLAEGEYYLAHPVRDAVKLPTQEESTSPPWQPCISFAKDFETIAARLEIDDFAAFLHEFREQVHLHGLHTLAPGDIDREVIRKIAGHFELRVRFKHIAPLLGISAGFFGAATVLPPPIAIPAAVLGGTVAVAAEVWKGHVPRQLGKWKWLRWMVRFDVEDQVKRRE